MILEEYNEDLHIKNEKDISYNDGFVKGRLDSMKRMLKNGYSEEEVIKIFDASDDEIKRAKEN